MYYCSTWFRTIDSSPSDDFFPSLFHQSARVPALLKCAVSSNEYNDIQLHSATASLKSTSDLHRQPSLLTALINIFIHHKVEKYWGPCIICRHFSIPSSTAVLYGLVNASVERCTIVSSQELSNARPRAYLLNQSGHFQAYEFESESGPDSIDPPAAFLIDLAAFLQENKLDETVGFCKERTSGKCGGVQEGCTVKGNSPLSLCTLRSLHRDGELIGCFGCGCAPNGLTSTLTTPKNLPSTANAVESINFATYTGSTGIRTWSDAQYHRPGEGWKAMVFNGGIMNRTNDDTAVILAGL